MDFQLSFGQTLTNLDRHKKKKILRRLWTMTLLENHWLHSKKHLFSSTTSVTSWWLNQPIWKKCASQIGSSPQVGVKIKHVWNHRAGYNSIYRGRNPSYPISFRPFFGVKFSPFITVVGGASPLEKYAANRTTTLSLHLLGGFPTRISNTNHLFKNPPLNLLLMVQKFGKLTSWGW